MILFTVELHEILIQAVKTKQHFNNQAFSQQLHYDVQHHNGCLFRKGLENQFLHAVQIDSNLMGFADRTDPVIFRNLFQWWINTAQMIHS